MNKLLDFLSDILDQAYPKIPLWVNIRVFYIEKLIEMVETIEKLEKYEKVCFTDILESLYTDLTPDYFYLPDNIKELISYIDFDDFYTIKEDVEIYVMNKY